MRAWALFSEPIDYQDLRVRKIMIYEKPRGETRVFLYTERDSQICRADEWYPSLLDALEIWDARPHGAWVSVGDPLPGCQEDAALPVRVKGRDAGSPEWGKYEILRDGVWREYTE